MGTETDELLFASESDELIFADETDDTAPAIAVWKVAIVDDEEEVHHVTQLALDDFSLDGKPIQFLSAFSAAEAEQLFAQHPDIAVVLLDVVMETDDAGLNFVKYLRQTLKNDLVRIILRTGQPGRAPEREVILNYGINDYKAKTELTANKLFTTLVTALRERSTLEVKDRYATQLQDLNTSLEEKVADRTAELQRANQEIQQLNDRLKTKNLLLTAELEVTRQLQQMLLPNDEELGKIEDLDIAGFMEPATEVGGGYYDVFEHNGLVKICIGDVTGHGLESGVLMLMVQTAVRTLVEDDRTDVKEVLQILNRTIYNNLQRMKCDRNLTLLLVDYQDGEMHLSGQHEHAIVVRTGGKVEKIDTVDLGFPIGLERDIAPFVHQQQVSLNAGDTVILYTDGIVEADNDRGVAYGLESLCAIVGQHWQKSAAELRQIIIDDVRRHVGNCQVRDDMTLLAIKKR